MTDTDPASARSESHRDPRETSGSRDAELIEDEKDALRGQVEIGRKRRSAHQRMVAARDIARQVGALVATLDLPPGSTVAGYASRWEEPGTGPALEDLHAAGFEVLLPVLGPAFGSPVGRFTGIGDLAQRAPGRPLEPIEQAGGASQLQLARLILTPALAVDYEGTRLGKGGGWYDRALLHAASDATVVAVVHEEEVWPTALPRAPHDIRVGATLTPRRWWRIERH